MSQYPIYNFVSHGNNLYAAFYGAGVFKTADSGNTWTACHEGLTNFLARDIAIMGNTLFVGTNRGGVFKSSDKGETWQTATDTILHKEIWSLLTAGNRLYAGTSKGLFVTDDDGKSWKKLPLPRPKAHHQIIFSLAVNGKHILAGTNSHVYLSEDFGETWEQNEVPTNLDVMSILHYQGEWLVGTSGDGIFSAKDGREWQAFSDKSAEKDNTRILILADGGLVLGLSTRGVVNVEEDGSQSEMNEGFNNASIRSLTQHQGKLYAGTYKQGIWRYDRQNGTLPTITNSRIPIAIGRKAVTIYPNPTENGLVTIQYNLEENSTTSINLYDAFGRNIAEITPASEQYKGAHQVSYDMKGLSGGTYYFHLQLGDQLITKPIVLIKQ